jgi:hypothetical protein
VEWLKGKVQTLEQQKRKKEKKMGAQSLVSNGTV